MAMDLSKTPAPQPDQRVIDWLLNADPAIRWQVRRDLLDEPPTVYELDQARVATEGWGAALLARQDAAGTWGGGLYGPKWIWVRPK